jgi:hypothetical protein
VIDKQIRIFSCPVRKLEIMYSLLVLHHAKIKAVDVQICFWDRIKLGNQLSDVGVLRNSIFIGVSKGEKQSVSKVELPALQKDRPFSVR